MLDYNDKISELEKYLKISNIGLGRCTCVEFNMELIYSVVKTPRKWYVLSRCFIFIIFRDEQWKYLVIILGKFKKYIYEGEFKIMNKSEIIIKGVPAKASKLENGNVNLIFKIGTYDDKESIYSVVVKKEYWRDAVLGLKDVNYFVIKGELKACVNSKGIPFISVEATYIKIFKFLKDDNGEIDLNYEVPDGTDEIVDISKLVNENEDISVKRSKRKAINYMKNNNKFSNPIVVKRESFTIVSGHDQYVAAQELGIKNVPVSYEDN